MSLSPYVKTRINAEVAAAVQYVSSSNPMNIAEINTENPDGAAPWQVSLEYADYDDEAVVDPESELSPEDVALGHRPNEVIVESPAEVFFAARSLSRMVGVKMQSDLISRDVHHERRQLMVAREIGYQVTRYGLIVARDHDGIYASVMSEFALPGNPVSKLGLAAIVAAPDMPMDHDLTILNILGYDGLQDVKDRIQTLNNKAGYELLPMPRMVDVPPAPLRHSFSLESFID